MLDRPIDSPKTIRWKYGQKIRTEIRKQGITNEVDVSRIIPIVCDHVNNMLSLRIRMTLVEKEFTCTSYCELAQATLKHKPYKEEYENLDFENEDHLEKMVHEAIKIYENERSYASMYEHYVDYGRNMWERWKAWEKDNE